MYGTTNHSNYLKKVKELWILELESIKVFVMEYKRSFDTMRVIC